MKNAADLCSVFLFGLMIHLISDLLFLFPFINNFNDLTANPRERKEG